MPVRRPRSPAHPSALPADARAADADPNEAPGPRSRLLAPARRRVRLQQKQRALALALGKSEERLKEALASTQRLTRLYAALSQCNEAIVRCADEGALFARVCEVAVTCGGMAMAWIGITDPVTGLVRPVSSFGDGVDYLDGIVISTHANDPHGLGPTGAAIRENRPVWSEDFPSGASTRAWRERGARQGWAASGAIPLTRAGKAIGAFTLYVRALERLDAQARRLLVEMAADISFALDGFAREGQRTEIEGRLRESERRYRTVFADSSVAIFLFEPEDGRIVDANQSAIAFYGWSLEQLRAMRVGDINTLGPEEVHARVELTQRGEARQFDVRHRLASGELRDVEVFAASVTLDGAPMIVSSIIDVTARKEAERALAASLDEKGALLKEVHHRVKNNLQVIISLLRLEAGRSGQPASKAALAEMQGRIQSMALLHETLYRSDDLAEVDLAVYLTRLAEQLFRAAAPRGRVRLDLQLGSARINLEQAIPCGLLVNELLSNCLKHAFPDDRRGVVTLALHAVGDGPEVVLAVSDDGVGLPVDLEARRAGSLGLQLVVDLARQLRGALDIDRGEGARFSLRFTPSAKARSPA
jgi:PAS domain S-box-containing protein